MPTSLKIPHLFQGPIIIITYFHCLRISHSIFIFSHSSRGGIKVRRRACCIFYNAQVRYFAIFLELLKTDLCNLELKEKDFFGTYFERILDLVDISCGSKKNR